MKKVLLALFLLSSAQIRVFSQEIKDFRLNAAVTQAEKSGEMLHLDVQGDPQKIAAWLNAHGGKLKYAKSASFWSVMVPGRVAREFLTLPFVGSTYFSAARGQVMNDTMRVKNNIDSIHQGYTPLHLPYTGAGVICGIIDTGVDGAHPDLRNADGSTRILGFWDQTAVNHPTNTPVYGYGQVYDSSMINANFALANDPGAHGTTVAGCASGNANATGNHKGVAPQSHVLVVKNNLYAINWLATISDAVDWMYHVGDSLNMPVVINVSLGTYDGSHDGRDPDSRFIDSLIRAKRGRLMVAAAGNSGNSALYGNYHLRTDVGSDTSFTWVTYNPSSALGYGAVFFEAYADTADLNQVQFAIGADAPSPVYSFRGKTDFHNVQECIGTIISDTIWNGSNILGIVDFYAQIIHDTYLLQVHLQEPDSNAYLFRMMSTGQGAFDVWSASWMGTSSLIEAPLPTVAQFPEIVHYASPDSAKVMVSGFQCLETVVTVANYAGANAYLDYNNNLQTFPYAVQQISVNSSRGPTRDNRQKPDIAATGDVTMSAGPLSNLAWMRINEPFKVSADSMHMRNGGTSMASPVIAGIGALMLEKCPTLRWDEFLQAITQTAKSDGFTAAVPNITWGYGKVDAFRALVSTAYLPAISGNTSFCFGDSTILSASGYSYYTWNTGDTTSSVLLHDSASLSLQVADLRGCKSDTAYVQVIEYPQSPDAAFTSGSIPLPAFVFNSTNTANTYAWYIDAGSGFQLSGTDDSLVYAPMGNFSIYLVTTDVYGCSSISDTVFYIEGSTSELDTEFLHVFPNPSSGEVQLSVPETMAFSNLEVYNIQGKRMQSLVLQGMQQSLDFSDFSEGVYLLRIENNEGHWQQIRLMIIK
jgi:subtilisin family serine protease